jgi:hypothetical protein
MHWIAKNRFRRACGQKLRSVHFCLFQQHRPIATVCHPQLMHCKRLTLSHLISSELNRRRKVSATVGSGVDPRSTRSSLQEKTISSVRPGTAEGLTRKHLLPISCEWCSYWEYFSAGAWYVFVRVVQLSFRSFNKGAPPWRRRQRKRKRRRRNNFELGRRNFKCDARDWRLDVSSRLLLARHAF